MNDAGKPGPPAPKTIADLAQESRDQILKLVFTGLCVAIIQLAFNRLAGGLTSQPWHIVWFLIPLAVAGWLVWRGIVRRPVLRLRGRFLAFVVLYVLAFSLAAGSSLLDWKRTPVGFEGEGPRNWLALGWLEDWHYWLAGRAALPVNDMAVVTRDDPAGRTLVDARMDLVRLIGLASANQAKAVVLDFYFDERETTPIDALLCRAIDQAEKAGVPVVTAYQFGVVQDQLVSKPPPPALRACLTADRRGHAIGFREPDLAVRLIPLYFRNDPTLPALSLQAALRLASRGGAAQPAVPDDHLLQFLPPPRPFTTIRLEELGARPELTALLRDRVIVAGTLSNADRVATPFGVMAGVAVQAAGLYALRSGHYVRHAPWWSSLLVILLACYVLAALAEAGAGPGRLVAAAALISGAIVAAAALTMYMWLVWLDVIYPLAAIWLLVALLPPLFRLRRIRPAPPR